MLNLTRKAGETIAVDGPAVITVKRTTGGRTTLGIEAPKSTRIIRGELDDLEQPGPTEVSPRQEAE